jgi:hypothetical protein
MYKRKPESIFICCAIVAALAVWIRPAGGQSTTYKAPQTRDGQPNLNGIWQAINTANWDIEAHAPRPGPPQFGALFAVPGGPGVVVDGPIPYNASALAKREALRAKGWTEDPEAKCYLPGLPRATYMPFPFQIVQGTSKIMIVYEFATAARVINMDTQPKPPIETWMGQSNGRWEGQTLVVDVKSLNGLAWFDRAANLQSESLRVVERYTPRSADALDYEARMEDPTLYTRPWTIRLPLYRRLEKDAQVGEFKCVPFSEELLYGDLRKKKTARN